MPHGNALVLPYRLIARSLARFALVIWGASTIVFILFYAVTDPARSILPIGTPNSVIQQYKIAHGLAAPLYQQYATFLGHAVQGNFGQSLRLGEPALTAALHALPITAALVLCAIAVGSILGILFGTYSSLRPGSIVDTAVRAASYLALSTPQFWFGVMLVLLFSVRLRLFPAYGYSLDFSHFVLPVATLSLVPFGHVAQITREGMEEETHKVYVTAARANGQSLYRVAIKHQFRNVLPTVLTVVVFDTGHLLVGDALVVEVVFGWPGIGHLGVTALQAGDIYVVQAVVVVAATVIALLNLLTDLAHRWLDPQTRARWSS